MSMSASTMLFGIGAGALAEVLPFSLLRRLFRLDGKSAGLAIGLLLLLIYVPWAILNRPGADVFAIHLAIFLTVACALAMIGGQVGRGWQVRKGWLYQPVAGQQTAFAVAVSDRDGRPVSGVAVSGRFLRSSNSRDDFDFAMAEAAPGEYRAKLQMPLHGVWELVLRIRRGADVHEIRAETSVEPGKGQR
jgi:hypothetical protein